ncbi:MAG: C4-dicarboxylate ABC transporter [Burkholderiales bacterium]|nr:C4-dicarboxylate ABC transporter [Burkholderiales bacterium]
MTTATKSFLWQLGAVALALAAPVQAQDKPVELRLAHSAAQLGKTGFEPWARGGGGGQHQVPAQQLGVQWRATAWYVGVAGYRPGAFALCRQRAAVHDGPRGGSAAGAWYRKRQRDEGCEAGWRTSTRHAAQQKLITEPGQIRAKSADGPWRRWSAAGRHQRQVSAPSRVALERVGTPTFPWDSLISFGIDKVARQHIDFRLYAASFVWVLNKGFYDKLGAGQKKVIDAHCSNEWAAKVGAAWGDWEDSGEGKIEKMGGSHQTRMRARRGACGQWIARRKAAPTAGCWRPGAGSARKRY